MGIAVRIGRTIALTLLATLLAACSGGAPSLSNLNPFGAEDRWKVDPNKPPETYKQDILDRLQIQLSDPTNIRGAFVTQPALKQFGQESRYTVCLRYNARKLDGQYEGSKDVVA